MLVLKFCFFSNGDDDEMGNASSAAEYNDVNILPSIGWVKEVQEFTFCWSIYLLVKCHVFIGICF